MNAYTNIVPYILSYYTVDVFNDGGLFFLI